MTFLAELKDYITSRGKWWLAPVLLALLAIGGLLVLASTLLVTIGEARQQAAANMSERK